MAVWCRGCLVPWLSGPYDIEADDRSLRSVMGRSWCQCAAPVSGRSCAVPTVSVNTVSPSSRSACDGGRQWRSGASVIVRGRRVRGSRDLDPKDLDPGFVRIIDPTLTVCRQIHWDHRFAFAIRQEIHSDLRSKTPYCVGIHRDPISDNRNSRNFCLLCFLKRLTTFFHENIYSTCDFDFDQVILLIFYPEIAYLKPDICEGSAWIHDFLRS